MFLVIRHFLCFHHQLISGSSIFPELCLARTCDTYNVKGFSPVTPSTLGFSPGTGVTGENPCTLYSITSPVDLIHITLINQTIICPNCSDFFFHCTAPHWMYLLDALDVPLIADAFSQDLCFSQLCRPRRVHSALISSAEQRVSRVLVGRQQMLQ